MANIFKRVGALVTFQDIKGQVDYISPLSSSVCTFLKGDEVECTCGVGKRRITALLLETGLGSNPTAWQYVDIFWVVI